MQKYLCEPCGYVYDPEIGDRPGYTIRRYSGRLGMPDLRNGERSIHCRRIKSQVY